MKDTTVHQTRTLQALMDISRYISASLDYLDIARKCLLSLSENLDLEHCALLVPDKEKQHLTIQLGVGWDSAESNNFKRPLRGSPLGQVYNSGMPIATPSVEDIPGLFVPSKLKNQGELVGFLAVPLLVNHIPIAVLMAYRVSHRTMLDEDMNVMKIVASILSQTMKLAEYVEATNKRLQTENDQLHAQLEDRFQVDNLVSSSGNMAKTLDLVKRVSTTDATVLLRGESGTGKTLIAQGIHFSSLRKKGPLVIVNCAAIPQNLIESELFGHEKGAFTSAISRRIGKFEAAEGGTLFLDEIGELSLETQAKLLRVIQDGAYEKVGSNKTQIANARIICATNMNLEQAIHEKKFREDLYYRLMVVPIYIPSLRSRKEDILPLTSHFLKYYNSKYNKNVVISREGLSFLEGYDWSGNVRELQHTLERTVILSNSDEPITDIPILNPMGSPERRFITEIVPEQNPGLPSPGSDGKPMNDRALYERVPLRESQIITALEESVGIQTVAAKKLGISLRQLRYAIKKYNLNVKDFKY